MSYTASTFPSPSLRAQPNHPTNHLQFNQLPEQKFDAKSDHLYHLNFYHMENIGKGFHNSVLIASCNSVLGCTRLAEMKLVYLN